MTSTTQNVVLSVEPDAGLLSVVSAMVRRIAVPCGDEVYFDHGHARQIYKAITDAAPAPSSLAGGEVSRAVACVDQVAKGAQVAEVYGGEWCLDPALEFRAHLRAILAALSPEAPAREGVDLEEILTAALTSELQDGGANVPYSIIAERVAARVADEASAPPRALTTAAEEALSFLKNAPLESGICCCGDPISGHGYGSGHSPVDDLAYHSSQVAEKLQAALTPRHEAPFFIKDGEDPAEFRALGKRLVDADHEAPAEGAGEDALSDLVAATERAKETLNAIAGERRKFGPIATKAQSVAWQIHYALDALRARSSAPEAREGEAVGLDEAQRKAAERAAMDAGAYIWRNARLAMVEDDKVIGYPAFSRADMAELARLTNVTTALPAAPSADKLRIAAEALGPFAKAAHTLTDEWDDDQITWNGTLPEAVAIKIKDLKGARQALAALKAEGVA